MVSRRTFLKSACLLATGIYLPSCAVASRGSTFLNLLPEEKEIEIGKAYVPYAIEEFDGLYPDKDVQNYVRNLGNFLARGVERKLPYQFYVVNSSQINAFALPGGPVMITRSLLSRLGSESELAAVLSHELGHINARHHARFLEKQFGLSLLLNLGSFLLGDKPYGRALLQFGQIGAGLLALKFSRDQEREADRYGIVYVYRAGYDPLGMVRVFELFKSMERGGRPPEWLSTHPLPDSRIAEVKREIERLKPHGSLVTDTQDFQTIKAKLLKTQPSFELFDRGKKAFGDRNYRTALEHFQRALELYPDNYVARAYMAYILATENRLLEAERSSRLALGVMPHVFLTNYVHGYVKFFQRDYQESLQYLQKANQLIPDHASTHYYLGRNYEALGQIAKAIEHYKTALELSQGKASWAEDARERLRRLGGVW
ncbi:MAG: M48 family metalloprotease [Aquificaceae bacterium]|nr:M48 family metalloprotease [Aquificaceae bacterium]MDW8423043.1 M48 family metalloprotease [Aquificaceae bacterium]